MAVSLMLVVKVLVLGYAAISALAPAGMWATGQFSPREKWSDKAARDPQLLKTKLDYFARREMGHFAFDPQIRAEIFSRSVNGTGNGTAPIAMGQCATDSDCDDHGDCIIEGGYGRCECQDWYATQDDDDPCGYERRGRWGTFMLTFIYSGAAYAYLSDGNGGMIAVAVIRCLSPVIIGAGFFCAIVPGVVLLFCSLGFWVYELIAAGTGAGLLGYSDGFWEIGVAMTKFF